jgi:hypothetical protein
MSEWARFVIGLDIFVMICLILYWERRARW